MTISIPAEPTRAKLSTQPSARASAPRLTVVPAEPHEHPVIVDLDAAPALPWRELHQRAIEPNAYYDPLWAVPVALHARGRGGAQALLAWNATDRLIGLMPVRSAWRALSIPGPMLVGWSGYASLTIPTLDRDEAIQAAGGLLDAARKSGARALFLPGLAVDGAAFAALEHALKQRGLSADTLRSYRRAALDCTGDADATLREALGAKKLKELRRQRHRLEDAGALSVSIATTPQEVAAALETFLVLEAKGWKGARGTALIQDPGDAAFIRTAATALAAQGRFEIVSLMRNGATIASGLILRDGDRAYFFKIAMDESEARTSPGVQLTLDITRHLCADPNIAFADSSTDSEHPMIDHVWRARIAIADIFIALSPRDPVAAGLRLLVKARMRAIDIVRSTRRIKEKLS